MDDLEPNYEYSDTGFPVSRPIQYFTIAFRSPSVLRLINVDQHIASCVQEKVEQLLPLEKSGYVCFSDYHTGFTGRFNIYDLVLEKPFFKGETAVGKEDATLIRVALCRILGALYCIGYDVVIASDVARTRTNGCIFFKLRDPSVDVLPSHYYSHKFVCVAPYSTDTLLLINIPKTMLEKVIKVIHLTWSPGVKSKQTLADDNRSVSVITSLKIHGQPWSQAVYNSGKASVQARLILLEVIKIFAENNWRLACNVNLESTADSLVFQWCPNLDMDEFRFCAISLNRYDRLRLVRTPVGLVGAIKEAVIKHWYLGLQKTRDYHGTVEFKLGGCPWWADSNDAVESRYFVSTLIGLLKVNGWQVCGTMDLTRRNNDKSCLILRQSVPKIQPHMCISLNKTNRIRLIVSSTDISEEAELRLTSMLNETIKNYWVALGPRNYGKSIEWKLEGDPWVSEGLYSDSTRGIYLLCLILQAITPLGWRVAASMDVAAKNLDSNDRYSYEGLSEDMHTWFFLYDEKVAAKHESENQKQQLNTKDLCSSTSVPNLEVERSEESLYYPEVPTRPVSSLLQANPSLSRSVPGIPAAAQQQQIEPHPPSNQKRWNMRNCSQRPPGLGSIPRQKSLDSSLAAAQMNPMGSLHNRGPTQGSTSNLYNQFPANSNATFSTFRQSDHSRQGRHCYATRHEGENGRRPDTKHEANGYRSDGYKSDGYKSDGYKSDGDGYKSDGAGYKSDGEHVKRRNRYNSPGRQPSKYELDRLAGRRLQPNGDSMQSQFRNMMDGGGACCREGTASRAGSRTGDQGTSRSSSRGGYRSDPENEIEIQLQCIGSQDDSGGSQHSHRGYSVDEDEIVVVEEQIQRAPEVENRGRADFYRPSDGGESRTHSRNGYKSDGSHGSTQESPLHPKNGKGDQIMPMSYSSVGRNGKRRMCGPHNPNLNNHAQSHSSTHLNAQYMQHPQRLVIHPTKHLEASRSFHTFQRQESTTSFHSTHSAPNQQHGNGHNLMVNNIESASQASTHSHSSSSSASAGPPDYHSVIHPPPSYDQALIKLDIAMRRRAQTKNRMAAQQKGTYNSLHYVGEFYG
eukprot:TRINITY_DN9901_c0_g1_i1.p1 TRINITY_DN9901_c0_g1~~TRINITY_DN9901_c0_g1_i1.p1  ORF type:complete len:1078 (+),score=157.12 TRINITY_DN9901_c0_g1_i1:452-3685(+)